MSLGQQIAEKWFPVGHPLQRKDLANLIDTMHAADKEAHAQKAAERIYSARGDSSIKWSVEAIKAIILSEND